MSIVAANLFLLGVKTIFAHPGHTQTSTLPCAGKYPLEPSVTGGGDAQSGCSPEGQGLDVLLKIHSWGLYFRPLFHCGHGCPEKSLSCTQKWTGQQCYTIAHMQNRSPLRRAIRFAQETPQWMVHRVSLSRKASTKSAHVEESSSVRFTCHTSCSRGRIHSKTRLHRPRILREPERTIELDSSSKENSSGQSSYSCTDVPLQPGLQQLFLCEQLNKNSRFHFCTEFHRTIELVLKQWCSIAPNAHGIYAYCILQDIQYDMTGSSLKLLCHLGGSGDSVSFVMPE